MHIEKNNYRCLVLGATGLVGRVLVNRLLADNRYQKVICLVRRPLVTQHYYDPLRKLEPIVIDFETLQDYQGYFSVDHVYCCLGTTMKKAQSKQAFRRVDFEYIHVSAQLARAQRVQSFVWVSSVGANAKSNNFYLRVKGELENAILSMPQLKHAAAVRPSFLLGDRDDKRSAESIGGMLAEWVSPALKGPLAKYKPVAAEQVAAQMIALHKFE